MTATPRTSRASASALPSRLVLLGHPVTHSLSPIFQNAALDDAGISLRYTALDVAPSDLSLVLSRLVIDHAAGNVTIPHKRAVFAQCDVTTAAAKRVQAVNTFWVDRGVLHGDNTDIAGFDRAVQSVVPSHRPLHVTLLGAGGAASAVAAAISTWPDTRLTVWNRSATHAETLARSFAGTRVEMDLPRAVRAADLVINATPIGLHDDRIPVTLDWLRRDTALYDLVYRPGGTPWIQAARARGHAAEDGLGMLVEQGALAFERWLGQPPNREAMWRALTTPQNATIHSAPNNGTASKKQT